MVDIPLLREYLRYQVAGIAVRALVAGIGADLASQGHHGVERGHTDVVGETLHLGIQHLRPSCHIASEGTGVLAT